MRTRRAGSLAGNLFIRTWRHRSDMRGTGCYAWHNLKCWGLTNRHEVARPVHRRLFKSGAIFDSIVDCKIERNSSCICPRLIKSRIQGVAQCSVGPISKKSTKFALCAMILPACYDKPGIQFFTRGELSQQLASMSYPTGKTFSSHMHNPVRREVFYTQEALFIRKAG